MLGYIVAQIGLSAYLEDEKSGEGHMAQAEKQKG